MFINPEILCSVCGVILKSLYSFITLPLIKMDANETSYYSIKKYVVAYMIKYIKIEYIMP
jgi:hypothetical protein